MQILMVAIGIGVLLVIAAPFLMGRGGHLAAASSINSKEKLLGLKNAILQQYLKDEAAFKAGELSQLAWTNRRNFLVNRYIDCARRYDFLSHVEVES